MKLIYCAFTAEEAEQTLLAFAGIRGAWVVNLAKPRRNPDESTDSVKETVIDQLKNIS